MNDKLGFVLAPEFFLVNSLFPTVRSIFCPAVIVDVFDVLFDDFQPRFDLFYPGQAVIFGLFCKRDLFVESFP